MNWTIKQPNREIIVNTGQGLSEDGIPVGNWFDKYGSRNPLVRRIMLGFERSLDELVELAAPSSVHEVGCGEGHWVLRWRSRGIDARGSDFSAKVIEVARQGARASGWSDDAFSVRSIYDLDPIRDAADLVVCCEVLEHLERPEDGLRALRGIVRNHLIVSVPREPLWRALNVCRGKYIRDLGNTPGHLQHWSKRAFVAMLQRHFQVLAIRSPLPWTMLLCK